MNSKAAFAYIAKGQAETSVLFELISARYERRSLLITANQRFGEWNKVFPDPAMTLAAVDRLVRALMWAVRRQFHIGLSLFAPPMRYQP